MKVQRRGIQFVFLTFVALTMLVHCGADSAATGPGDDESPSSQSAAALCVGQWDPSWQEQTPYANNWWVEYAITGGTVTSARLEVVGVGNVPLSFRDSKWVGSSSFSIATGTKVVLHAQSSLGQAAQTAVFGYLSVKTPVTDCAGNADAGADAGADASADAGADASADAGADAGVCWSPSYTQATANNWWVEYAITSSGSTVTSAYLEVVGVRNVPLALQWSKWQGSTGSSSIATGTPVVVHATNSAAQSAHTPVFKYLVDKGPLPTDCGAGTGTVAVRYVGRRDTTDPDHPKFGWPGARIIGRFNGTAASVMLNEQSLSSGPSRWDVLVDGVRTSTLTAGTGTYAIASGLPNAVHTIELYKRTEGSVGVTQFMGYVFPNGGQALAPPAAPTHRIEFLGDSTTAGYGDECTAPTQSFSGATENERLAFSGLVAHDLNADHQDTSFSGKGVLLDYSRSDTVVFDQLFLRTIPTAATPAWDFTRFTPDVVWMTLGANDWSKESSATLPPDLTAFTNKYVALVALVRSKYPSAQIFCAIAPSLNDDDPVGWNVLSNMRTALANVVSTRAAAGDTKVSKYEFTRAVQSTDLTGCNYHGNLGLHRKMADEVIVQIKAKMPGW